MMQIKTDIISYWERITKVKRLSCKEYCVFEETTHLDCQLFL